MLLTKRKHLIDMADKIGRSIRKHMKEQDQRDWKTDIERMDRLAVLLSELTFPHLRMDVIGRMEAIKAKHPIHVKKYNIPKE